jgi:starch-binding outer membrane protein, SusD/RagB family
MKNKKHLATFLLIAGTWVACSEKRLDVAPTIPIVTVDNFFSNEVEAVNAVNATYTPLSAIYNGAAWHLGDIMSDDTDLGGGGGGDGLETAELDNFNVTPFNPIIGTLWAQCYFGILRANLVLDRVPKVPVMGDAVRKRSLGEGRFLRALYYWHLVRIFGDVPLYTNVITAEESAKIPRSPKADVFKLIVADLKEAETLLPDAATGANAGRATSGAAKGLLSAVYLWLGDKANAAAKAKEVIDGGKYRLNVDYANNFNLDAENGIESLFEIQYRSGGGQWSDFGAGQKLNTFFAPRGQGIVQSDGYGWNVPTRDFVNQYTRSGAELSTITDKRRPASMWMPGDRFGAYTQPAQLVGSPNGFNVRKYFIPVSNTLGDNGGWTAALNVPFMRYSEVLLTYAEAAGPALGKPFIDQVRQRAGLAPLPAGLSEAQYLEAVYKERRLEFAFEMHRWYDLLRHPDPNYFINVMRAHGKTNVAAKHRYMPIPQGERDRNSNLTQNEGY